MRSFPFVEKQKNSLIMYLKTQERQINKLTIEQQMEFKIFFVLF